MAFNSYMHERNIYRNQPDFNQLALDFPKFRKYAVPDAAGKKVHVDFSNPDALRMLSEILLKKDFNLDVEIPQGFLIPTIPQRLNYILWLEDLLHNIPQKNKLTRGIDIGTGPCAIFSILGARKNNWNFIATETSDDAIYWAKRNIEKNNLDDNIKIVKVSPATTLSEILSSNKEKYDFCLCNPPFFENIDEIRRKHNSAETIADLAQTKEIFFSGGELSFVRNILRDSLIYQDRVCLFTSMFGKKKSFLQILKEVKELKEVKVTTSEFCQGNTVRWGIAWTFMKSVQFEQVERKIKPKKAKSPYEYQIPIENSKDFNFNTLLKDTRSFLKSLLIPVEVTRSSKSFAELLLKSDKNTWIHQRRKRREVKRQVKGASGLENQPSVAFGSEAIQEQNICGSANKSKSNSSNPNCIASTDIKESTDIGYISKCCNSRTETLSPGNIALSDCDEDTPFSNDKIFSNPTKLTSTNVNLENDHHVLSGTKRKDFSSDNLSSKRSRLELDEKNGGNFYSKECSELSLESSKSDFKESCVLETNDILIKKELRTENCLTNNQITSGDNCDIQVPDNLVTENSLKDSNVEIKVSLKENLLKEQITCLSPQNNQLSSIKEDKSLTFEDEKGQEMDAVCLNYKSNSSDDCKISCDLKIQQIKEDDNRDKNEQLKSTYDSSEKVDSIITQEGSVLHCHLRLQKLKKGILVTMNCPPSADRNTMHQVFQLVKNAIK